MPKRPLEEVDPQQMMRMTAQKTSGVGPILVSETADVARLGGAIASRISDCQEAMIRSIGPAAAYRGIKSVVNAAEYLRDDVAQGKAAGIPDHTQLALWLWEE